MIHFHRWSEWKQSMDYASKKLNQYRQCRTCRKVEHQEIPGAMFAVNAINMINGFVPAVDKNV